MKEYNFVIRETISRGVTIRAESEEEAREMVLRKHQRNEYAPIVDGWDPVEGEVLDEDGNGLYNWYV